MANYLEIRAALDAHPKIKNPSAVARGRRDEFCGWRASMASRSPLDEIRFPYSSASVSSGFSFGLLSG